jgi:hypothetical protein
MTRVITDPKHYIDNPPPLQQGFCRGVFALSAKGAVRGERKQRGKFAGLPRKAVA